MPQEERSEANLYAAMLTPQYRAELDARGVTFRPGTGDRKFPVSPVGCLVCGVQIGEIKYLKCAGCLGRSYCSKVCQKMDWKALAHKVDCEQRKEMLAASRRNVIVSRRFDDDGAGFDNGGPRTDVALCMLEDAAASKDAAKLAFEAGQQEDALDGYHFAIDVSRAAARRAKDDGDLDLALRAARIAAVSMVNVSVIFRRESEKALWDRGAPGGAEPRPRIAQSAFGDQEIIPDHVPYLLQRAVMYAREARIEDGTYAIKSVEAEIRAFERAVKMGEKAPMLAVLGGFAACAAWVTILTGKLGQVRGTGPFFGPDGTCVALLQVDLVSVDAYLRLEAAREAKALSRSGPFMPPPRRPPGDFWGMATAEASLVGCRESQWVAMSLHSCGPGRSENSLRMRCADRHADGDHVMNSPWEEERSISRSGSDTAVARATRHILEFVRDVERAGIQVVDLNLGSGLFAAHPSENAAMEAGLPPHCTARRDSVHVARDAMLGARN